MSPRVKLMQIKTIETISTTNDAKLTRRSHVYVFLRAPWVSFVVNAFHRPLDDSTIFGVHYGQVSSMALHRIARRCSLLLLLSSFALSPLQAQSDTQQAPANEVPTFHATVRRVVVDVVVRDSNNKPVHGLKASDFVVAEDGHPQNVLSFDAYNLDSPSIALPPTPRTRLPTTS